MNQWPDLDSISPTHCLSQQLCSEFPAETGSGHISHDLNSSIDCIHAMSLPHSCFDSRPNPNPDLDPKNYLPANSLTPTNYYSGSSDRHLGLQIPISVSRETNSTSTFCTEFQSLVYEGMEIRTSAECLFQCEYSPCPKKFSKKSARK